MGQPPMKRAKSLATSAPHVTGTLTKQSRRDLTLAASNLSSTPSQDASLALADSYSTPADAQILTSQLAPLFYPPAPKFPPPTQANTRSTGGGRPSDANRRVRAILEWLPKSRKTLYDVFTEGVIHRTDRNKIASLGQTVTAVMGSLSDELFRPRGKSSEKLRRTEWRPPTDPSKDRQDSEEVDWDIDSPSLFRTNNSMSHEDKQSLSNRRTVQVVSWLKQYLKDVVGFEQDVVLYAEQTERLTRLSNDIKRKVDCIERHRLDLFKNADEEEIFVRSDCTRCERDGTGCEFPFSNSLPQKACGRCSRSEWPCTFTVGRKAQMLCTVRVKSELGESNLKHGSTAPFLGSMTIQEIKMDEEGEGHGEGKEESAEESEETDVGTGEEEVDNENEDDYDNASLTQEQPGHSGFKRDHNDIDEVEAQLEREAYPKGEESNESERSDEEQAQDVRKAQKPQKKNKNKGAIKSQGGSRDMSQAEVNPSSPVPSNDIGQISIEAIGSDFDGASSLGIFGTPATSPTWSQHTAQLSQLGYPPSLPSVGFSPHVSGSTAHGIPQYPPQSLFPPPSLPSQPPWLSTVNPNQPGYQHSLPGYQHQLTYPMIPTGGIGTLTMPQQGLAPSAPTHTHGPWCGIPNPPPNASYPGFVGPSTDQMPTLGSTSGTGTAGLQNWDPSAWLAWSEQQRDAGGL